MPFLGEVPITAFFSRTESTSKKRKVTTSKTSSNKRQKKEDTEVISNAPSIDNSKGKKDVFGSSMVTREEEESSMGPIVLESMSRKKQAEIVSFLTPLPARNLHVTARKTPPLDVDSQSRALKPNHGVSIQRRAFFLPTPTTMLRPHASQSHRNSVEPDSQEPVLEPVHSSIHCSPSRNRHNPFSMSPGRPQPSTPKGREVFPGSLQPTFLQKDDTTFEDFSSDRGIVIGSSQSQLLSPVHKSPQRPQTNSKRICSGTSLDEESIPSSQVQERELAVSCMEPKSRFRQVGIALPLVCLTSFLRRLLISLLDLHPLPTLVPPIKCQPERSRMKFSQCLFNRRLCPIYLLQTKVSMEVNQRHLYLPA